MSIEIMTRVWKQSKQTECSRLLLLLALADHADPEGICFPGVPHLARKIRKTERHVRRLLRDLERDGEIYTGTNRGPHLANLYLVTVGFTQDEVEATLIERLKVPRGDANRLAVMLLTPDAHVTTTPDAGVRLPLTPTSTTPDAGVSLTIINHQEPSKEPSLSPIGEEISSFDEDGAPVDVPKPKKCYVSKCEYEDEQGNVEVIEDDSWKQPQEQIDYQALGACGRESFRTRKEYNKLRKIEAMLESGKLLEEFWRNRMASAEKHHWSFPKLLSYTLSVDLQRKWKRQQQRKRHSNEQRTL